MLDYTAVVLDGRTLGWRTPHTEDVVEIVRRFHRDSALAVLLRLNLALTHHRPLDQQEILRRWLQPDLVDAVFTVMREEQTTHVFHEGQILNLIRLVILNSPPDDGFRCTRPEEFHLLMRAMLWMSDLMFPYSGRAQARESVFTNFTRSELFMHDEHYVPHVMARNYDLFVMLPRIVERQDSYFDIAGGFQALTGMEIEDYVGLGFGLLTHYDTIDVSLIGDAAIGVQRATYLTGVRLPEERRDGLWGVLSKPVAAYRDALRTEWDSTTEPARWFAMRTFSQFPMIEFPDGTVVAVSRRLLRDRITHGIYWVLANGLTPDDRQAFTNFFGDLFEEYVRRCFLRALGRSFRARPKYGRGHLPLVDGALVMPRSLGLPECKAGRLLLNVREVGSEADLHRSVEPGLERAATQIAGAIQGGQRGEITDIATGPGTRYYPIIVTYEALPSHPFALEVYERIIHRNSRLQGEGIKPVTLLNTRDVESLEALIQDGEAWPDLLTRKHTGRYRFVPFHNYVYRRFGGTIPRNDYLRARWDRIGNIIGMRLFGKPLEAPGSRDRRRPRRRR